MSFATKVGDVEKERGTQPSDPSERTALSGDDRRLRGGSRSRGGAKFPPWSAHRTTAELRIVSWSAGLGRPDPRRVVPLPGRTGGVRTRCSRVAPTWGL